jgi:hypothetical protein
LKSFHSGFFFHGRSIHNKKPDTFAYLWRCQPDTTGCVHRFKHVGNDLFYVRAGRYVFGPLAQYRIAIHYNGINHDVAKLRSTNYEKRIFLTLFSTSISRLNRIVTDAVP